MNPKPPSQEEQQQWLVDMLEHHPNPDTITDLPDKIASGFAGMFGEAVTIEDAASRRTTPSAMTEGLRELEKRSNHIREAGRFLLEHTVTIVTPSTLPVSIARIYSRDRANEPEPLKPSPGRRAQTILYLVRELGGSLTKDALTVRAVSTTPAMPQNIERYTIEMPGLDKAVFLNRKDEEPDYIFSLSETSRLRITTDDLDSMTKNEKDALINLHQEYPPGVRIPYDTTQLPYGNAWTEHVRTLLSAKNLPPTTDSNAHYDPDWRKHIPEVVAAAPDDYLSISAFAITEKTSIEQVYRLIHAGKLMLPFLRFGSHIVPGLSPMMQKILKTRPELSITAPPGGYIKVKDYADDIGRSEGEVKTAMRTCGIRPGFYREKTIAFPFLSEEERKALRGPLGLNIPIPELSDVPVKSVTEFIIANGVIKSTIYRIMDELGIDPPEYRFHPQIDKGLTPEDRRRILEHKYFQHKKAGEDVQSVHVFTANLREQGFTLNRKALYEVLETLGVEPGRYFFRSRRAPGLTTEQQAKVVQYLRSQNSQQP